MAIRGVAHFLQSLALCSLLVTGESAHAVADPSAGPSDWNVSIGVDLYSTPAYPGSNQIQIYPLPYQDITWRGRFFSTGFDFLGVYLVNNKTWKAGFDLAYDPTWRHHNDDLRFNRLKDIDATVRARAFAQVTLSFLTLTVDAAQDIGGQKQGLIANADLYASLPLGAALFSVGPGVSWGNDRYMRTFFGITPEQAAHSAFPQYTARSGLSDRHLNAIGSFTLSPQWQLVGTLTWAKLAGTASDSPVVEQRRQVNATVLLSYRFH